MGYTTDFYGSFLLDKTLSSEHYNYLKKFANTRRMVRDPRIAEIFPDPVRQAAKLPIGPEGAYYVSSDGFRGQEKDASIIDYNGSGFHQPSLWCQWEPSLYGNEIIWNGTEKFYCYVEWIEFLIKHFLKPWGYRLNGTVIWAGEEKEDRGKIVINNNKVSVYDGITVYKKRKK